MMLMLNVRMLVGCGVVCPPWLPHHHAVFRRAGRRRGLLLRVIDNVNFTMFYMPPMLFGFRDDTVLP